MTHNCLSLWKDIRKMNWINFRGENSGEDRCYWEFKNWTNRNYSWTAWSQKSVRFFLQILFIQSKMTSDFRKPATIKSSNGDQLINTEIMYNLWNTLKNFLCCKTFAAKVLKYSEIRSYKIKPKQVYLGGFGFT